MSNIRDNLRNKKQFLFSFIIKNVKNILIIPIKKLINGAIYKGVFPQPLKIANVIPISKTWLGQSCSIILRILESTWKIHTYSVGTWCSSHSKVKTKLIGFHLDTCFVHYVNEQF